MARPSKYGTHVEPKLNLVEAWARDGLTDEQIANNLGVAYSTFREYKKDYPALSAALQKGKDDIDVMVENALLKAALGFEYEEEQVSKDGVYSVKKYAQPNTTALIFWLKNRRPQAWRDKQDVSMSGGLDNTTTDMTNLTPEERKVRINELIRKRGNGATASAGN